MDEQWQNVQLKTYIQQVCADTECSPEDLPEAIDEKEGWQERVKDIHADSTMMMMMMMITGNNYLLTDFV